MKPVSNIKIVDWVLRIVAAVIMIQSLFYKFSGADESVFIFSKIGMEPWGRYVIGTGELISSLLLVYPKYIWFGALMGIGLMAGAIFFHFTILGIQVQGDHGYLFSLACITFVSCCVICFNHKKYLPFIT